MLRRAQNLNYRSAFGWDRPSHYGMEWVLYFLDGMGWQILKKWDRMGWYGIGSYIYSFYKKFPYNNTKVLINLRAKI